MNRGIILALNVIDHLKEELSKVNIVVTTNSNSCKIKLPSYVSLTRLKDCKYVDRVELKEDASVIHASYK